MKKFITFLFIALIPVSSNAFLSTGIPKQITDALDDAHASGNDYLIKAVIKYSKEKYPNYAKKIDSYHSKSKESNQAKIEKVENKEKKKSKLSGSIDGGINLTNGNTKETDINSTLKLNYETNKWINSFKAVTRYSSEDNLRTNEEYTINNQIKYKLNKSDYAFLELEYVNDVFSGFQYRNSELIGYGHKFYDNDKLTISGEISGGARQSLLTTGQKENSILGKVSSKTKWQITDQLTLNNDSSSSFGSDAVITIIDTSLRTELTKSLYLRLNYNIQHVDDAPTNKNQIDTITSVGVGYNF